MKAFPVTYINPKDDSININTGMDLRDYFAAKAMQAIVSTVPHMEMINQTLVAIESYQYADEMMKARDK